MPGLYDGVEEIPFKKTDGGYVFKTNNPWLIGPRRYYFVTEAQKVQIAACLKDTLQRLKPFVLIVAILMPLAIGCGIFWLVSHSGVLTITETDAVGKSTTTVQSIDPFTGSSGKLMNPSGLSVIFHVNSASGKDASISYTSLAADGKLGFPTFVAFASAGARLNLTDTKGKVIKSVMFIGRAGGAPGSIMFYAMLMTAAFFIPYLELMNLYGLRRLRPLIGDLPRTDQKITWQEETNRFATKISTKMLSVMAVGCCLGFIIGAPRLVIAYLEHRPFESLETLLFPTVLSALTTAYFIYVILIRLKTKRETC